MTYQEFKNKYNGKYVDVDNYPKEWPYQCFDLAQLYAREVINVPDYVFANCKVVKNLIYDPTERAQMDEYFDEVSTIGMQQGDVCIWGNGDAGHIAIFDHYNPQDNNCYYFSQNPNPCQVMVINLPDHHAFRRKQEKKEELAEPVARDECKDQIEVKVDNLRIRDCGGLACKELGKAKKGFYDYYEVVENNGYKWYRITDDWRRQWVASSDEWTNVYPKKEDKYITLKVLEEKDGYALVDLGKVYIKP